MSSPNHILAAIMVLLELTLIPQTSQGGQQEIRQREKAKEGASASKVSCLEQPQTSPPSVSCAEEEFRKKGRPLMQAQQQGLAFGVSSPSSDSTEVFMWIDNRTDQTQSYFDVCRVSFLEAFAVLNSAGERVLTKAEQRAREPHSIIEEIEVCSCCIFLSIPPHTLQVVDHGNLSDGYTLSSGTYFIVPIDPRTRKLELSKMDQAGKASFLTNAIKIAIPSH